MDKVGNFMDKIGPWSTHRLLSGRVRAGRYFFLQLAPKRDAAAAVAFGGREACRPDYAVDRDRFAYYVLEYVAEGQGRVWLGERSHRLEPGSAFAYAPATRCRIETDPAKPMVKYFLCLAGCEIEHRLQVAGLPPGHVRLLLSHAEIRSVWEDLIREGQRHGSLARDISLALFNLLLLKLRSAGSRSRRRSSDAARESFSRCKAIIDAEAERLATLEEVADAAGVEASSICRLFRRFQGTSPYQYLLRRKMTLAAERLVENGGLVKEAALRIGFQDPYHFSRCFKSVHGVAPSELLRYRRGRA